MHLNTFIIKTGESETWINDQFDTISFGDVLRTTAILPVIESANIKWIGSKKTSPLIPTLDNLQFVPIDELIINEIVLNQNNFLINLEKIDLMKQFNLKDRKNFCGFFWLENEWYLKNIKGDIFTLSAWIKHSLDLNAITWGAKLQLLLGKVQSKTSATLNQSLIQTKYDIGLNWQVGPKWPSKQIPEDNWKKIEDMLSKNYKVSWQEGYDSLGHYMEWIQSCRLIITTDSLGLHLAIAYQKPVIALFGATSSFDVDKNDNTIFLNLEMPPEFECRPCFRPKCDQKIHCSNFIDFNFKLQNNQE